MKMSFLPGRLELVSEGKVFVVSVDGNEVFSTQSRKIAMGRFNEIRREMEKRFPPTRPTAEDSKILLAQMMNDVAVDEALRRPPKKRSSARSSRTFGG